MQNIWLTSDTHFDHRNIMNYEPTRKDLFKDEFHMTDELINRWNELVKPNDLIFHLGDVFFCKTEKMKSIAARLNGRKVLIRGNHDKGISNTRFRRLGFDVHNYYILDDFLLSHYPQQEIPLRTLINNTHIKGNIHGHVHSNTSGLDQSIYQCVSVELTNFEPIHIEEVKHNFEMVSECGDFE